MLIILFLLFVLLGAIVSLRFGWGDIMGIIIVICSVALLFCIIAIPINYYDCNGKIVEFKAIEQTYQKARRLLETDGVIMPAVMLEKVSAYRDIAKSNAWLASTKYYNSTIWDIWIPDAIEDLEPIE